MDKQNTKSIFSKPLPYGLALIAIILALVQTFRLAGVKEQYQLLTKGEDAFIKAEYEDAFSYYEKVELDQVDENFLSLRKNLAGLKDYDTDAQEAKLLTENIVELLKDCAGINREDFNLYDKSLADLAALLKVCYVDAKGIKEEKLRLVKELSKVDYLSFTNERGHFIHYLGTVIDSMAYGEGVGIWDNESFYRGQWQNNNREGFGYFRTAKGEVYEGEYKNDRRNGMGTYTFRNGDHYIGEWKNGERSGFGTVISASGDTLVHGYWERDRYDRRSTRAAKNGEGEDS